MQTSLQSPTTPERNKGARYPKPELIRSPAGNPPFDRSPIVPRSDSPSAHGPVSASRKVDDISRHESVHDLKHEPQHGTHPDAKHEPRPKAAELPTPGPRQRIKPTPRKAGN